MIAHSFIRQFGASIPWGSLLAVILVAGCTRYHPVDMESASSWAEARTYAARAAERARQKGNLASVASDGSIRHVVLPGQTVSEIAVLYDSQTGLIKDRNRLGSSDHIRAGQILAVPLESRRSPDPLLASITPPPAKPSADGAGAGRTVLAGMSARAAGGMVSSATRSPGDGLGEPDATRTASLHTSIARTQPGPIAIPQAPPQSAAPPPGRSREDRERAARGAPPPMTGEGFMWPVEGRIISRFGEKPNGFRNDGVNIAVPLGTPIRATENGIVVYAGSDIPSYGQMLLIRHEGDFMSAYAHNASLAVAVGDVVQRGQVIAHVGATGDVTTPQLHFELREGKVALDPTELLTPDLQLASR